MLEEEPQSSSAVSPAKEKEPGPFFAILHTPIPPATPVRRQSIITLHPASEILNNNNDNKPPVSGTDTNNSTSVCITNNTLNNSDKRISISSMTKTDLSITSNGTHNDSIDTIRRNSSGNITNKKDISITNVIMHSNSSQSIGQVHSEAGPSS